MKKKILVVSLIIVVAVMGVFTLSSCASLSEEFSPFRDTIPALDASGNQQFDKDGKLVSIEGVAGYTFNPAASTEGNNSIFKGAESIMPVSDGGNYKAEKAFPVKHVGSVYDEDLKKTVESEYPVVGLSSNAFYGEKSLKRVVLPDCYYVVGTYAFFECQNLEEIVLPAGLREIRQWAFYDCKSLKTVYFRGTEEQWKKLLTKKDNGKRDINELGNTVLEELTKQGKVVYEYQGN